MVKIIRRERAEVRCGCGATLEYGPGDVHEYFDDYFGRADPDRHHYVMCPDCRQSVGVGTEKDRGDHDL